ncbi:hypothetical protein PTKIN_Ptkin19aG0098100 [Pterospermum kingtungense]
MSVRFKFRSSPNYDSVDIGGRSSISVRDLKSRIVQNKKLNLCQDFDLLFSDPISGQEYLDEDFKIPCGSDVIIKRVPAGPRVGSLGNIATTGMNISKTSHPENADTVDFDDFGTELCPVPDENLSGIDLDIMNKFCSGDEETNIKLKRCCEQPAVECHKLEVSNISEAIPQGQNVLGTKLKPDIELNTKMSDERVVIASFPAMQNADFPSELKCSLCNTFFKDAVMIPCCQHSFCEKCIRQVLVEKARCPKCYSTKCKVEDLLPNLSLRQAIERFMLSQILINGSENALHQYAPDGESGIQGNDVSCAVSILHRGVELRTSPSATGRGSNQVPAESDLEGYADFEGENHPINDEAGFNVKKRRELWVNTADAGKSYVETGRLKKGDRACYMCGSPGHLRRECPAVPSPYPMLQGNGMFPGPMPGYVSAYWNASPFPHMRPFSNPYGISGMMPYNATVIPTSPFPVPTYMPSMFGLSSAFGGFTRMGGTAAAMKNNIDHQLFRSELDVQDYDKRHQFSSENVVRGRSASYSEDSFAKKSHMKRRHPHTIDDNIDCDDEKYEKISRVAQHSYHHSERSRSEVDDMPSCSSWHSEERHKHGHRSSKKQSDRREQCDSDSSWIHYKIYKEKDVEKKTVKHDAERRHKKHQNLSESSLEINHSSGHKKRRREKDSSRSSRHSRQKSKSARHELSHERWQMTSSRSEEENQEDYHYYKRKKVY